MRRRILTAAVVLTALVAAACGGSDDTAEGDDAGSAAGAGDCPVDALESADGPVEITMWHAEIGLPARTLQAIVDDYHDSQDRVRVSLEFQGTFEEQLKKYEDAMADPGSLPDIVVPDDTVTQFMADSGTVVPAEACIDADPDAAEIYDDMVPIVEAAYSIEDVLWPGAYNAAGAATYVNLSHMEAAGLDPEQLPGTLDELRETAEALRDAGIPDLEAPLVMRIEAWPLEFWTSGAGTAVVDEDNGRSGLATEAQYANDTTQEILAWLRDMEADGLLKYTDRADPIAPFLAMATQTSSILIDTSAAISTVDSVIQGTLSAEQVGLEAGVDLSGFAFPELRLTVGELPGLSEPGKGQMGGGAWYLVDGDDDAKLAASWDFMKFFNSTDQQARWAMEASYFPVRRSAVEDPELQALWTDTQRGRWMAEAYRGFTTLDPDFPGPVIGPYKEFREAVRGGVERIILEGEDVDATMDDVDAQLQEELDAYARDVGA